VTHGNIRCTSSPEGELARTTISAPLDHGDLRSGPDGITASLCPIFYPKPDRLSGRERDPDER
jgi:hypothetical protein